MLINNICIESCSSGDECLIASTRVCHSNDDQVSAMKESGRTLLVTARSWVQISLAAEFFSSFACAANFLIKNWMHSYEASGLISSEKEKSLCFEFSRKHGTKIADEIGTVFGSSGRPWHLVRIPPLIVLYFQLSSNPPPRNFVTAKRYVICCLNF